MTAPTPQELDQALQQHSAMVAPQFHEKICEYCELLWHWNSRLNLTRHTCLQTFVTRDVIDTLQLEKHIPQGASVLDIGSGGGVPGILLAIIRPDLNVSLAESVRKKAVVLERIVARLKLNVPVHAERGESVLKSQRFDVLTVRAVASLRKLLFWFQRVLPSFDQMLLIKGPRWTSELEEAESEGLVESISLTKVTQYKSPGHDGDSVVLSVNLNES